MRFGIPDVLLLLALVAGSPCAQGAGREGFGLDSRVAAGVAEDPLDPPGWEAIREFQGEAVDTVRESFPDGRPRRIACYLAGRRDAAALQGPEWTWWPNGALQGKHVMLHGKQDGPSVSCYESGVIESRGEFREDGRHGQWNFFNEQGILKAIRNYDHGEPHGQFLTLFANGTQKIEQEFERGLQVGIEREWSPEGEIVREAHYRAGKLHGALERTVFLPKRSADGAEAPEPSGDAQETDSARKERRLENYEDGRKSGTWVHWDENGTRVLEENYAKDQLHGLRSRWRSDGTLAVQMTYTDGRVEGELTGWYDNGQMQMRGQLADGKRTGSWQYWRPDGSLIAAWSGEYDADRKVSD